MSEYERNEVMALLDEVYAQCGSGLNYEECLAEGWLAYVEAKQKLSVFSEQFWQNILIEIVERLAEIRKDRNRKMALESKLSLDQTIGDSREDIRSILFPVQGDFTNGVILWQYAKSLGKTKYKMMQCMAQEMEDADIIEKLHMTSELYYKLKEELKNDMKIYKDIN